MRGWVTAVTALVVTAGFLLSCAGAKQSAPVGPPTVDPETLPDWVLSMIDDLASQPVASPPAYIARYWYRDQVVFFVPAPDPHAPSVLYDADGTTLCHPSGGNERGGSTCPDFFQKREGEEIVWRDERKFRGSNAPELIFLALATLQVIHITWIN